jgi:drug/metabolite transporter (DMT)-like permease
MYTLYSLVQEEISTALFDNEHFTQMQSLLLLQCLFNVVVAWMCVAHFSGRDDVWRRRDLVAHAGIGFTYVTGMLLSNTALVYIKYHEQVLVKSSKPIFILLVARIVGFRRFPVWKYVLVVSITLGGVLFMIDSSAAGNAAVADTAKDADDALLWGRVLVFISLILDGITALQQDALAQNDNNDVPDTDRPTAFHLMLYVNVWASVYLTVSSLVTGELQDCVRLLIASADLRLYASLFATCSCLGQLFIFQTIRYHGALLCSMITTTRKFSTVLLSVVLFGHPITVVQVVGVCLLFGALFADIYMDTRSPPSTTPSISKKHSDDIELGRGRTTRH